MSRRDAAADLKNLLQRKDIALRCDHDLVAEVHSIKRRVLPPENLSFDAERGARGRHADRFSAIALACRQGARTRAIEGRGDRGDRRAPHERHPLFRRIL